MFAMRIGPIVGAWAIGLAAGAWAGFVIKGAELDRFRETVATEKSIAKGEALAALLAARQRGDALTFELQAAHTTAQQRQEQIDEALSRATVGRPCLGPAALRLLDRAAAVAPAALPPAAGLPAATDAEPVATDTEVARWANTAYGQYAECTRRLDALIQFNESAP
jgi:hypothetical protein